MIRPRFSIRTFLLAATLLGFVGIPVGHRQYLKWRESQSRRGAEIIHVAHADAAEIAVVLRAVYSDRVQSGNARKSPQTGVDPLLIDVEANSNSVIISGPKDLFREIRELIRALDASPTADDQVVTRSVVRDPEMIKKALRSLLDSSP